MPCVSFSPAVTMPSTPGTTSVGVNGSVARRQSTFVAVIGTSTSVTSDDENNSHVSCEDEEDASVMKEEEENIVKEESARDGEIGGGAGSGACALQADTRSDSGTMSGLSHAGGGTATLGRCVPNPLASLRRDHIHSQRTTNTRVVASAMNLKGDSSKISGDGVWMGTRKRKRDSLKNSTLALAGNRTGAVVSFRPGPPVPNPLRDLHGGNEMQPTMTSDLSDPGSDSTNQGGNGAQSTLFVGVSQCTHPTSTPADTGVSQDNATPATDEKSSNPVKPSKTTPAALPLSGRQRIFSIDLDSAGLDFFDAASSSSGNPDAPGSVGAVPVGAGNIVDSVLDGDFAAIARDRGMSFELFSLGVNVNEPLPPPTPAMLNMSTHSGGEKAAQTITDSRPRGDSIIFDPVSFSDGGIHEESALMQSRKNSLALEETDEIAIMNAPGFAPAPSSILTVPAETPQGAVIPHSVVSGGTSLVAQATAVPSCSLVVQAEPVDGNVIRPDSIESAPVTSHTADMVPSSGEPGTSQFNGNAIVPSALHGTPGIHPDVCPMELINKGGRIGIYLPEARKARIARFHERRKMRIWRKRIKYDCRKKLADSRPRIKGRFVRRSDVEGEDD